MKNRYSFVSLTNNRTASANEAQNAKTISGIEAIINASYSIGKYVFSADEELSKVLRGASAMSITEVTSEKSGITKNRVEILLNGRTILARVYGSGSERELLPAKEYKTEEIKNAVFGFCTSDGERVTELKRDASGNLVNVPVIYLHI